MKHKQTINKRLTSQEKNYRYSFRKLKVGLASVAVAAVFFGRSVVDVQANDLVQSEETTVTTEYLEPEETEPEEVIEEPVAFDQPVETEEVVVAVDNISDAEVELEPIVESEEAVSAVFEETEVMIEESSDDAVATEESDDLDETAEEEKEETVEEEPATETVKVDKASSEKTVSAKPQASSPAVQQVSPAASSQPVQSSLAVASTVATLTEESLVPAEDSDDQTSVETTLADLSQVDLDTAQIGQSLSASLLTAESQGELHSLLRSLRSRSAEQLEEIDNLSQLFDDEEEAESLTKLAADSADSLGQVRTTGTVDEWILKGLNQAQFASIQHEANDFSLVVKTEAGSPNIYYNNAYASLRVINANGTTAYSKDWIGSGNYTATTDTVALQAGDLIYLSHREASDSLLVISPATLDTESKSPEVYVVQEDGSITPYLGESRENGVLVQEDSLGFPILFLLGNGTAVSQINGSTAGMQSYPLTSEDFAALGRRWNNDVTGPIEAIRRGYGYEQGEDIEIDMSARFELSDFAKDAGYEIVSITPGNLPSGLYYDSESRLIKGAIREELENFSSRLTVEVVVSNGENTFTWTSSNIGAIIWKDTKGPTIKTTNLTVGIGEEVVIDWVARDENGNPKASAEATSDFYVVDGSWTLPLPAGTVSLNDYYDLMETTTTKIDKDSLNSTMSLTFRYSETGSNFSIGLPAGLTYDSETGQITGVPTTAGTYYIEVTATDFEAISHPQRDTTNWKGLVSPAKSTTVFTLTVADMAYVYTPEGLTKEVEKNAEVTAEEMIGNVADLPEGTTFAFTRTLNTATAGTKNMSVKVTYPDDSSELVPVTIIVTAPMNETYRPITQAQTISRGESIEASSFITNISTLPEGTNFSFVTEPDTDQLMTNRSQFILVSYPDGTTDTVIGRLTVTQEQNLTYEPETKTQVLYRGDSIDAKDSIANPSVMPATATYSFEPEIDTNVLGYHTVTLVVTYSDGTQDKVSTQVHIYEDQKDTYEPIAQVQTVKVGETVFARDSVANTNAMPGRTVYEFLEPVDTSTAGTKTATVRVTYWVDETYDDIEVEIIVVPFDNEASPAQPQDQAVLRGTRVQASDFVANASSLPQNTTISFVDPVSTEELGDFPVKVLVTYPDKTTNRIEATLTVYEYDNNRYTPVAQDQKVEKNTQVAAKDSIANTAELPAETQYSFVTEPDLSKAGTLSSVVKVLYPDQTEDLVDVKIIVTEPNSDTYEPTTKDLSIFTNETVAAKDFVTNSSSLPAGTAFSFETAPDTSTSGTVNLTVVATYPDQSTDKVEVTLTINPRQNEIFEPVGQEVTIAKGGTPVAADSIANKDDLAVGSQFAFKSNVNTQTAGPRYAVVVTTYPDGTQDETRVRIVVTEPQADTYTPVGSEVTVGYGGTVSAAELISNKAELPADATYTLVDTVDTTKEGRYAVTVQVTYADKSEETVAAVVRVVDDRPDAEKYEPTTTTQTVEVNTSVDANLSIANLSDLPAGTTASFTAAVDTSTAGTKNTTITVLYPDGTSDRVMARVIVRDSRTDAEKYEPVTRDQIVNRGDNVVASRSVTNFARLPIGTRVAFTQAVDTSTGGDFPASILVSYPDGSSETVSVTITVLDNRTDAEKYEPDAHDTTVSLNETVDPASLITNLSSLPETASVSFVTQPDTSQVGTVEATVQVAYADGTSDRLPVTITVVDSRPDASKYPAQTQVQEVDYYFGHAEPTASVANWSALPAGTTAEYFTDVNVLELGDQPNVLKVTYPDGSTNYYDVIVRVVDNSKQTDWHEPVGLDHTVEVGETALAQDSIANKADLPEGTSYAFIGTVDTIQEGEQTVTVLVTYPDQSTDQVSAKLIVVHKATQAETTPAVTEEQGILLGDRLEASDFIRNLSDLPTNTQVTFATTPDWSQVGSQEVELLVAYPDGSSLPLTATLRIIDARSEAEIYEPIGQVQTIELNTQPQAEQSLANLAELPEGTQVAYLDEVDSSKEGRQQVQLHVMYPDDSSEVILVEIRVVDPRPQAQRYEPVGQDKTVELGTAVKASDLISNVSSLPSDAVISFVTQPDTSSVGTVPTSVRVTYADGSVDQVSVKVTVVDSRTDADRYQPVGQDKTVEVGTAVAARDLISNASSLPSDAVISFVSQPDTSSVGAVPTSIRVTYADGSIDQVNVTVTVIDSRTDADRYQPVGQDKTVEVGTTVTARDLISNVSNLPSDAVISFVSQPDTSSVGTVPTSIRVTYADGSIDQVNVTVTVIDSRTDADRYQPVGQDKTVEVGTAVAARDLISNVSSLPSDAVISFVTQPDTSSVGTVPTSIRVTYADGSIDQVNVTVTVIDSRTDADRYQPVGQDTTVEVGTVVTARDLISNVSNLPSNAVISFVTEPDTSNVGPVPTSIRVTYTDGSVDHVNVVVTVVAKPTDQELFPVETQDLVREINSHVGVLSFITNYDDLPKTTLIRYLAAADADPSRLAALLRAGTDQVEEMSLTDLLAGQTDLERVSLLADKEGRYLMTFEVNYPDGSTDQVTANLTVIAPTDDDKEPVIRQVQEEIAFDTHYQANPQVEADQRTVLVTGQTGLIQLTYTNNRLTATERLREVVDEIIEVGTKTQVTRQTVAYQVKVEEDANLFPAESYTKQLGQDGEIVETTTYILDTKTGQLTAQTTTSRRNPVNEIQVIGTKTQVTRRVAIPYETRYEADDTRQGGSRQVVTAGHDGILTQIITNGVLTAEEISQESVTEVIVVGTKDKVVTENLPYITLMSYDSSLFPEEGYIKQAGQSGSRETRTTYLLNTETGEVTETVTVNQVDPIDEIQIVGTRAVKVTQEEVVLPYDTRYEADASLEADQRYVKVAGQAGQATRVYLDGVFSSETIDSPAVTEIIVVGTKPLVQEEELAYDRQVRQDESLLVGQTYVEQVGRLGRRVTTTSYDLDTQTGILTPTVSVQVQEPVAEIVIEGSRELVTTSRDEVAKFKTHYEADEHRPAGEQVVKQAGQDGITRYNYVDGALTSQTVVQVQIDEIILVGTQTSVDRQDLAFKHLVEESDQLLPEESYIKQAGQAGRQIVTTSYSLDEETGQLTSTVQVSRTEPVDEIQVRGTKQVKAVLIEVPFATTYQADETLPYGQTKVLTQGQVGQVTRTYTNGVLTDEVEVQPLVNQVIAVGTQSERRLTELPYSSQVEYDDQLFPEEGYIKQAGQAGVLEVLVTYTLDTTSGQVTPDRQEKRTEAILEIRVVGTKNQELVTEMLDFATHYQADDTLPYGQTQILTLGQSGQLLRTYTNGVLTSEVELQPRVDQVVAVGTQSERQLTELPYSSQVEYDDQLFPEESYIKQAGQTGLLEVLTTYTLDTTTGQVTPDRQEKRTEAIPEIRVVGIKNQEVVYEELAFSTRYQADDTLPYGQTKVLVEGQNGRQKLTFENGVLLTSVEELVPVTAVIAVGSQATVTELVLDYPTEIRLDATQPIGYEVEVQAGQAGKVIQTRYYEVDEVTGQVTFRDSSQRIEPQARILVQGNGANQSLAYETIYLADETLAYGQREIRQEGQAGLVAVTGQVLQEPQAAIIAVGTKPQVIETVLDFAIESLEDDQLPVGEEKLVTPGQAGLERQTTTYLLDEPTGQVTAQTSVERIEPQNQVVHIGTKVVEESQPDIPEEEPTQEPTDEPTPQEPIVDIPEEEPVATAKGLVIVRYLDTDGNALLPQVVAIESSMMGYPYDEDDFADKRLTELTTADGQRYVLAPSLSKGEVGVVVEGISYVDYIYLPVVEEVEPEAEPTTEAGGAAGLAQEELQPKSEATKADKAKVVSVLAPSPVAQVSTNEVEKSSLPNTGDDFVLDSSLLIGLVATSLSLVAYRRRDEE